MVALPKTVGFAYRKNNWFKAKVTSFCNAEIMAYEVASDAIDEDEDEDEDEEEVEVEVE